MTTQSTYISRVEVILLIGSCCLGSNIGNFRPASSEPFWANLDILVIGSHFVYVHECLSAKQYRTDVIMCYLLLFDFESQKHLCRQSNGIFMSMIPRTGHPTIGMSRCSSRFGTHTHLRPNTASPQLTTSITSRSGCNIVGISQENRPDAEKQASPETSGG